MMCSNRHACVCASVSSTAKVSLNKRSAKRWRRTTSRARWLPAGVSCASPSRNATKCRSAMRERTREAGSSGAEAFPEAPVARSRSTCAGFPSSPQTPNLLEQVVKANFVVGRDGLATVGCVHQGAAKRLARAMHCGVKMQVTVSEFDAAVGLPRDVRVMRDHQDRVTRLVQLAEDFNDDSFIGFVEIAGRFVGKYELRLVDQCAGNGHA